MKKLPIFSLLLLISTLFTACIEEKLAFDVIESPVLAVFDEMPADEGAIKLKATFYELDKTGILDKDIGIDSTLLSGLEISIYINENQLIESMSTDANGTVILEKTLDDIFNASRLEYVGIHNDIPFRIYKNI